MKLTCYVQIAKLCYWYYRDNDSDNEGIYNVQQHSDDEGPVLIFYGMSKGVLLKDKNLERAYIKLTSKELYHKNYHRNVILVLSSEHPDFIIDVHPMIRIERIISHTRQQKPATVTFADEYVRVPPIDYYCLDTNRCSSPILPPDQHVYERRGAMLFRQYFENTFNLTSTAYIGVPHGGFLGILNQYDCCSPSCTFIGLAITSGVLVAIGSTFVALALICVICKARKSKQEAYAQM
jgi:hypothetical protein